MNRESAKRSSLTAKAEAAFEQASRKVVEPTSQTKTPVILWKNGQVVEIPSEKLEKPTLRRQ
jgi:hypothetical protein